MHEGYGGVKRCKYCTTSSCIPAEGGTGTCGSLLDTNGFLLLSEVPGRLTKAATAVDIFCMSSAERPAAREKLARVTTLTKGVGGSPSQSLSPILHFTINYTHSVYNKQRFVGCQGTNYVAKPVFRYLNGDMCGVDWRSNPASTSMAPGRKICFIPRPCLDLSNRSGTRRNLLVKTFLTCA